MQQWYHIFPKNTGLSLYIWLIFCILPFYFIFRSSLTIEIVFGIFMILLFFVSYRLSFISKGAIVYICVSVEMIISIVMTLFFGYVYFALFLAFYIGNIQNKVGFVTLYIVHLLTTIGALSIGFFMKTDLFLSQLLFIIISVIGVILLPFNMYNRIRREKLEFQLEDANSQLIVIEERQRIARDLHDTLGQKLSLIGLKSDLAGKLIEKDTVKAKQEISDIRQTARTALKEVRELVSDMRGVRLSDEIIHVKQLLEAAKIEFHMEGSFELRDTPLLVENVLSMCLKEAVTNVVKHSKATICNITVKQTPNEVSIKIQDNGIGISNKMSKYKGHGLDGIGERLEFINGSLEITSSGGTTLNIRVPYVK